jgi:hypothetical protein
MNTQMKPVSLGTNQYHKEGNEIKVRKSFPTLTIPFMLSFLKYFSSLPLWCLKFIHYFSTQNDIIWKFICHNRWCLLELQQPNVFLRVHSDLIIWSEVAYLCDMCYFEKGKTSVKSDNMRECDSERWEMQNKLQFFALWWICCRAISFAILPAIEYHC